MGMEAAVKEQGQQSEPDGEGEGEDRIQAAPRELTQEESDRLEAEEAKQDAAVEAYARDHAELTVENEQDALDYLLAPKRPRLYDVKVQYDTDDGRVPLTFVVRGMDGRKMESMEQRHRSDSTGLLDQTSYDCELIAASCVYLESGSGRQVRLNSDEFLTLKVPNPDGAEGELMEQKVAAPPLALEKRFQTQLGLLMGVAREIRAVSGFDPQRVGSAHRRLVDAVGNS